MIARKTYSSVKRTLNARAEALDHQSRHRQREITRCVEIAGAVDSGKGIDQDIAHKYGSSNKPRILAVVNSTRQKPRSYQHAND
jgi:hypothetical protein